MNKVLIALCILAASLLVSSQVSAHVLVADESSSIGAVLHVMPDDDPIAGQPSDLYFDVQATNLKNDSVTMSVRDTQTGERQSVETKLEKNLVTATYEFPAQGVYELEFTVVTDKTYIFSYAQRVSRGVEGVQIDNESYFIADAALIASGVGFLVILVLFINNRREIKKHSTF